jgi:trk system potassium uptake protein TrkA
VSLNIVIIGAGEVGYNLTRVLSNEDYDITVVDIAPERCDSVTNNFDARVILGNGASQRVLQQIDMENVDYLLALTRIDEVNLVASQIATKLGAKKIICRLRNTEYSHKDAVVTPADFNIDKVVFPEKAAQKEIESLIRQSSAVEIQEFFAGSVLLVGIKLANSSPLIGRTTKQVEMANPFIPHKLAVVIRDDESFIPHKDTKYHRDDFVYFVGREDDIPNIQKMTGKPAFKVKNIAILGAGKIGRLLAKSLQSDYNVRIIEKDEEKAKKYGNGLDDALMVIGDGLETDFLESENIGEMDCFIAATEKEQTNILASLLVKHFGVKQVILHINTTNYIKSVRRIGVDAVVSKNTAAVNEVIKIIRSDQKSVPVSRFEDIEIESVELTVSSNSKYLRKKYTIDKIPENVCLGIIIRDGKARIPDSHIELKVGDKLLFFSKPERVSKVEDLFM